MLLKAPMVAAGGFPPFPRLRITVRYSGRQWSEPLVALVDSGASHTIVRVDVAKFIGLTREEISKWSTQPIGGVVAASQGYAARLDLRIGRKEEGGPLELPDSDVLFMDTEWPFRDVHVLLGQIDVLKKTGFAQIARPPKPFFTLRTLDRRRDHMEAAGIKSAAGLARRSQ